MSIENAGTLQPLGPMLGGMLPSWLREVVSLDDNRLLQDAYYLNHHVVEDGDGTLHELTVLIDGELVLGIPGVDAVTLVVGGEGQGYLIAKSRYRFEPDFLFELSGFRAGIRFSPDVLRPANPQNAAVELYCPISVAINRDFDVSILTEEGFNLEKAYIGTTDIAVELKGLQFDLGRTTALDEVLAAGYDESFRGIVVDEARIEFPPGYPAIVPSDLILRKVVLGSGGISGDLDVSYEPVWDAGAKTYKPGPGVGDLFGIPFALKDVEVKFRQGCLTACSFEGAMKLPFFDDWTDVAIAVDQDGRFSLALTGASGVLKQLVKKDLIEMELHSLRIQIDDGVATFKLAGKIKPLIPGLKWPSFDIDELSIDTEDRLSLAGGWIDLPQGYTLDLFAFKLEITKFGAGRDEQGNQYLGFNGGLDLVKGIPAGATVEGLRITWGPNVWPPQLSVKGVGCELTIPDKLHFKGEVSYEELGDLKAFTGGILLELPAINGLTIDGKIVFGSARDPVTQTRFKYFAIYLEGEFGTGIPLWASGLALNGIAGLFSVDYGPNKPNDWTWYSMDKSKSWFHKPPIGVTDIIRKWAPQKGTWAIGAGASIATYADGGHLFNGKFLLLLLFPGPVFMIDGRGTFLEKPAADKEPLFHALVVLDVKAGYFLIGLDAQWKYNKEDGKLVQIAGSAETFFNFNDPGDWHIYIGKDTPMEQRIRASFAGGLQANAYFMLDPRRLRLGVWIGKNDHYSFGPVGADLEAWLDANATLSFRPPHLGVSIWLHGLLSVRVFRWKFAIGLDARLEADVAKPFHILGSVTITIETRFKDFEFEVRLEWGPRPDYPQIPPEVPGAFIQSGVAHPKSTIEWALLADASDRGPIVPLDARPYFMFEQPVHDASGISVNPAPNPGWITIGDRTTGKGAARVQYELTKIELQRPKPGGAAGEWEPYPHKLYGAWGAAPPNPGNGGTQNRFMLYAKTPFDLTDDTDSWNPWAASNLPNYPCPVVANETICIDWQKWQKGTELPSPFSDSPSGIGVTWDRGTRAVVEVPPLLSFRGIPVGGVERGIQFPANIRLDTVAYVCNEPNGNVSVVNTFTDAVIDAAIGAPIGVGPTPGQVAFTPDGRLAFVSNWGSNTVSIIDTATNKVVGGPISVGAAPRRIAFSGNGSKAWVASAGTPVVSVIDVASRTVIQEITLHEVAWGIALTPDGSRLYVVHAVEAGSISILDAANGNRIGNPIQVPGRPFNIVFAPDGSKAYVPAASAGVLQIFDTKTNALLSTTIPLGKFPRELTITPNGSTLYVANGDIQPSVTVIDAVSQKVITTIPVGVRPLGIAMHPNGSKVYVALHNAGAVSVIDTATRTVTRTIPIGGMTQGIAVCPVPTLRTVLEPTEVFIDLPRGTAVVEVRLYQAGGRITGEILEPLSKLPPAVSANGQSPGRITLRFDAKEFGFDEGIRRIRIRSDQDWVLLRVCITRPALPGGLEDLTKLHDELADGLKVWGEPGAVLEPYTDYRITAVVQRTIVGIGELSGWNPPSPPFEPKFRFRTDGPPGIGKPEPPRHADKLSNKSGLEDLERYVAQTIPVTITPEGERPELQKPVYRGYDVSVMFNEDYVDRMYELSGRDLAIRLYDANDEPARTISGGLVVYGNKGGNPATVTLTETRRQWLEVLNAATCLPSKIDLAKLPKTKPLAVSGFVLAPDTLYEARLVPLLLQAPTPGGAGWTPENFAPGVQMLKRTAGDASQWTDVLINVLVRPMPTGLTGVAFRVGATARYVFAISAVAGKRSLRGIAGPARESAFAYDVAKQYQISIEAIGSKLRIEQDGELVFEVSDANALKGSVGLFPWLATGPQRFQLLSVHDFRTKRPIRSLVQSANPGGAGWVQENFSPGVPMLKRVDGDASQWTDVRIDVLVRPMPSGLTGVAFRVGATARYVFAIDAAAGKRSLLGAAGPARESAFAYDATKQYQLVIEAVGSTLRILQDGQLVFEVANESTATKGTIGLFPGLTTGTQLFEKLSVHELQGNAPVAYRFPFTTSRYVDFHHQIQSHSGETWTGAPLPSTFSFPATEPDEARVYDQLAGAVLGAAARQLPQRIEATRVEQGNAPFALLLRGDEPINWKRTKLTVTNAAAASPSLIPAGRMKITEAAFGSTQPADVVSVLLSEAIDPTGTRVEVQSPPQPHVETSGAPLLADKFAQNDLAGWTLVDEIPNLATQATSQWSASNGELRLRNLVSAGVAPSFLGTFAAAGGAGWTDVVMSARVRCPGGGAVGLVVRGGGLDDYYRFSMDNKAGYRQLVKKVGGTFTVLWRDSVAYDPTRTYELMLIGAGNVLRGFIDGVPLFVVHDAARPAGIVALYVWNSEAFFSNVRVDPIARAADEWLLDERFTAGPSQRWTFETQGNPSAGAWQAANGELLAPDLTTATSVALAGEAASTDYRVSARMLLGTAGSTALVFRHQSNARNYQMRWQAGFLRLVRVLAAGETVLAQSAWNPSASTETVLTVDCIGAKLTGYANGVRLFSVMDESIPSGRIGVRVASKTGTRIRELRVAAAIWKRWYTFESERKRDTGTRFEIRGEAATTLPAEAGLIRKFNAGAQRLATDGVALRVVDAGGIVVHARRFLPSNHFAAIQVRLMRSADSTGFAMLAQQGALTAGTYRLKFTYERQKTGVAPDLSRGGAMTSETATIDVTI